MSNYFMSKKKTQKQPTLLSPENYIRQRSHNLPIYECWITTNWKNDKMANIIIARKHASGNITYCMYLVDLACLGIKDSGYRYNESYIDYEDFIEKANEGLSIEKVSYDLVHNIIHASLEFAEEYGFEPHKDFKSVTQYFLEEDTEDVPLIEIGCGDDDGKPLYINSGMESNVRVNQILNQLEKTAGKGNFHYIIQGDDLNEYDSDYDEEEEDDDDDDYDEDEIEFQKLKYSFYEKDRDELKEFFIHLINRKDNNNDDFDDDDFNQLFAISEILIEDITDSIVIADHYSRLVHDLTIENISFDNELPNSLFRDVQNIDGETLMDMFHDTIDAIHDDKKASKAVAAFRKAVGDAPVCYYLELYYLKHNGKKKFLKKLDEAYYKYPDYFLIKMLWHEIFYVAKDDENELKQLEAMIHEEDMITAYELSEFMTKYAIYSYKLYKEFSFEKHVAFECFIKDSKFPLNASAIALMATIQLMKILKLTELLIKKDE